MCGEGRETAEHCEGLLSMWQYGDMQAVAHQPRPFIFSHPHQNICRTSEHLQDGFSSFLSFVPDISASPVNGLFHGVTGQKSKSDWFAGAKH